jgi:hypothetical protein
VSPPTIGRFSFDNRILRPINGGGAPGVALHSDAVTAAQWENFKLIIESGSLASPPFKFALQTSGGQYVTAINGGGVGGPNDETCPFHTDAATANAWEGFTFTIDDSVNPPVVTIQTETNNYVTAVNGGGVNGGNAQPIHTDQTAIGDWEKFTFLATALNDQEQITINWPINIGLSVQGNIAGSVSLTIKQTGDWTFSGNFNNSAWLPESITVGIGILTGKTLLGFSWQGGIAAITNNNSNFNLSGNNKQITANWANLMKGWVWRGNAQATVDWGSVGQAISQALNAVGEAYELVDIVGGILAAVALLA